MKNFLFYAVTVLIWGSTWLAIKFQLGSVDPLVSVAYRFALAAVILLLWCRLFGLDMRFTAGEHLFMALQGVLLYALNYWMLYLSEVYLASGLAAILFSTLLMLNVLNGALFIGTRIEGRVLAAGMLGLGGLALVFRPEMEAFHLGDAGLIGILYGAAGTYLSSLGNIVSARNQRRGLPVIQTNAYGMAYGAAAMVLVAGVSGKSFGFETSPHYVGALVYLAVFGSIIGFGCYLTLVGRIGAGRAAYVTLLFPIVALGISTVVEDYRWSVSAVLGVALILAGNLLIIKRRRSQ